MNNKIIGIVLIVIGVALAGMVGGAICIALGIFKVK